MKNVDKPEDYESGSESESEPEEFELLEENEPVVVTEADQPLTYTQMAVYYFSDFAKRSIVYSSGKVGGCLAVATVAPPAYFMATSYFGLTGPTSNIVARSTTSALVSASFDLGSHAGKKIAETTWDLSSAIISRTLTFIYPRDGSVPSNARSLKNPEKNNKRNNKKNRLHKE